MTSDEELQLFVETLAKGLRPDERLNASAFIGDPHRAAKFIPFGVYKRDGRWVIPGNEAWNRYISVSAFKQNEQGEWRRQDVLFSAACALMIDDIGDDDGAGVKLPKSVVDGLPPTFIIETSRGNYQYWYMFDEPFRDGPRFDRLVNGFIEQRCGGKDSGFKDTTRIARVPCSTNTKPEKGDWKVRIVEANPDTRYPPIDLADFWNIDMTPRFRRTYETNFQDGESRIYNFELIMMYLNDMGLTKSGRTGLNRRGHIDYSDFNQKGWMEITCPWLAEHTGGADSGTAIQAPTETNGMLGGFKCHHATCKDVRHLKELFQFVKVQISDDYIAEVEAFLNRVNMEAT